MQTLNEGDIYFKDLFGTIDRLTEELENNNVSVCLLGLIYRGGIAKDVLMLGYNSAFKEKVNPKVHMHMMLGDSIPSVVEFWLDKLGASACTKSRVIIKDYEAFITKLVFDKVTIYPIQLLGGTVAFGLVFEEKKNLLNHNDLCLKCPTNPTVHKPTVKMVEVRADASGLSDCALCQIARSLPSQGCV